MSHLKEEYIEEQNLVTIQCEATLHAEEKELERKDKALKAALFNDGSDAVEKFLGFCPPSSWEKDSIDNAMDEIIDQMSSEEYNAWLKRYDIQ